MFADTTYNPSFERSYTVYGADDVVGNFLKSTIADRKVTHCVLTAANEIVYLEYIGTLRDGTVLYEKVDG